MPQLAENPTQRETAQDFLPLKGTDHVEFYVGNARQAAYFYRAAFGMSLVAYRGPGDRHARPRFLLCAAGQNPLRADHAACSPDDPIADHIARHGDGVRDDRAVGR